MKKNKIIITGGLGFIGSHLVKLLLKENYTILNIDKISYASQKTKINHSNYFFKKLNIYNFRTLKKIINNFKPNIIVNCAAETHVDRSISSAKKFINSNILGTFNLLEIIKEKKNIKYIHVSTDEVFGSIKKGKFKENSCYNPNSPYAASKASSDHLVRSYGKTYKIKYCITNCTNNFGPYQYPEKLIPLVIIKCIKKEKIPVYGNGKNIRDWISVEDHCDALIKIIKKGNSGETYLIGANNEMSNIELVKKICTLFDKLSNSSSNSLKLIKFVKDRKGHDFRYAINNYNTKKKLKWRPKKNFYVALKETIQFYIENYSNLKKIFRFDNWIKKRIN